MDIDIRNARAISFDIETLGLGPDSVVLSIGMVAFNPFMKEVVPQPHDQFHNQFSVFDQIIMGREVESGTVSWWGEQSAAARQELMKSVQNFNNFPDSGGRGQQSHTQKVFEQVRIWLLRRQPTHGYWSRGSMDMDVMNHLATETLGRDALFPYNQWRDQRTLCAMFPTYHIARSVVDTEHDAYQDALYQARYIAGIHAKLQEQEDDRQRLQQQTPAQPALLSPPLDPDPAGKWPGEDDETEIVEATKLTGFGGTAA